MNLDERGQSALMYIHIKRRRSRVVIEQEIANNDDKNEDLKETENTLNIKQNKLFFNERIADQYAKDVLRRFIDHGCFPLTDA